MNHLKKIGLKNHVILRIILHNPNNWGNCARCPIGYPSNEINKSCVGLYRKFMNFNNDRYTHCKTQIKTIQNILLKELLKK